MRDKHNHTLLFKKILHSSKTPLLFTSVFVSLFLLSSSNALADVNLREGSFLTATSEIRIGRLQIMRRYNSRSMTVGAFGFGWQSNLDRTLTDPKGLIKLDLKSLKIIRDKDTHLVTEIQQRSVPRNRTWHYRYRKLDLVEVSLGKTVLMKYQYDDVHNLTEIIYPDGSNEKISYLTGDDQVKSYRDARHCFESYSYDQHKWGTVTQSRTSVERRCPASSPRLLTYEFWMKQQKNGTSVLLKAQIVSQKKKVNLNFDRVSGFYTAGDN